jgi:hypothetical protein
MTLSISTQWINDYASALYQADNHRYTQIH